MTPAVFMALRLTPLQATVLRDCPRGPTWRYRAWHRHGVADARDVLRRWELVEWRGDAWRATARGRAVLAALDAAERVG